MFRAHDPARDVPVAVKLFTLDLPPERVHQLVAEFEWLIAATLDHPALNAPLATGMVDASAYLVYDFVDAQSLDLAVREYGPAPAAHAIRVAAQLAGALDFAAAVHVTHGALHPRDVLLSATDIRITGIGISRALAAVGIVPPVRRPYTAPERVEGRAWDRRADVFSLAALVHELLWARRIGVAGSEVTATIAPTAGSDLAALRGAFARALTADPAARFATALEFAEALSGAFPEGAHDDTQIGPPRVPVATQPAAGGSPPAARVQPSAPLLPLEDEATLVGVPAAGTLLHEPADLESDEATLVAVPAATLDLDLKAAEEQRYQDVEAAPSIVEPTVIVTPPPPAPPPLPAPPLLAEPAPVLAEPQPPVVAAIEAAPDVADRDRRSIFWPVAAALAAGIAAGFFGGYTVASRDRSPAAPAAATVPAAPASAPARPAPPSGREFTENTVPSSEAGAANSPPGANQSSISNHQSSMIPPGRLLVRSTPAGARVTVDGRDSGVTPIAVRELANGTHHVVVTRDGYAPTERRVVITASRPAQSITVALDRMNASATSGAEPEPAGGAERFVGTLQVDSRPTGAKVFVDGRLVGSTPVSVGNVRAGEHAVRLEHDGYRRWSSSVRVVAAERNRVTASLER